MRYILENIFLVIFTKIDFCAKVNEENKQITFSYKNKTYELTIKEKE